MTPGMLQLLRQFDIINNSSSKPIGTQRTFYLQNNGIEFNFTFMLVNEFISPKVKSVPILLSPQLRQISVILEIENMRSSF